MTSCIEGVRRGFAPGRFVVLLGCLLALSSVHVGAHEDERLDLTTLSLEELLEVEVYSVSRGMESIAGAPAAVYVVTGEQIRRAGVTSLPDAFRLIPGMEVARIDANKWATSARGYNSRFANKLLVLIDGRSVYTPIYSGVYWDMHDISLEDVERIEVIRGPGASLWGANAVNGIISIVTAPASATPGGSLGLITGAGEGTVGTVRYGGPMGDRAQYRVSARYFDQRRFQTAAGDEAYDAWSNSRGAVRVDWQASPVDAVTFHAGLVDGELEQAATPETTLDPPITELQMSRTPVSAGHLQVRWERSLRGGASAVLQVYYDQYERLEKVLDESVRTADVDFCHRFLRGQHQLTWGLGYRRIHDEARGGGTLWFDPAERQYDLLSVFVQDEVGLTPKLELTLGAKVESNDFSGIEVQPSARAMWRPNLQHALWAAGSRAVRTPSRTDEDMEARVEPAAFLPTLPFDPGDAVLAVSGSDAFTSEELLALEVGYRALPTPRLLLDVAAYYHLYDRLRTVKPMGFDTETEPPPEHTVFTFELQSAMEGTARGIEVAADWQVAAPWRARLTYRWQQIDMESNVIFMARQVEGLSPEHQFGAHSMLDLTRGLEFDASVRYVDNLSYLGVDSYMSASLRLGWQPRQDLELYLAGHDLLGPSHLEYRTENMESPPIEVPRHAHLGMRWSF